MTDGLTLVTMRATESPSYKGPQGPCAVHSTTTQNSGPISIAKMFRSLVTSKANQQLSALTPFPPLCLFPSPATPWRTGTYVLSLPLVFSVLRGIPALSDHLSPSRHIGG